MIDKTGSMHAQLVMEQIKAYQTRVNQTREPAADRANRNSKVNVWSNRQPDGDRR